MVDIAALYSKHGTSWGGAISHTHRNSSTRMSHGYYIRCPYLSSTQRKKEWSSVLFHPPLVAHYHSANRVDTTDSLFSTLRRGWEADVDSAVGVRYSENDWILDKWPATRTRPVRSQESFVSVWLWLGYNTHAMRYAVYVTTQGPRRATVGPYIVGSRLGSEWIDCSIRLL